MYDRAGRIAPQESEVCAPDLPTFDRQQCHLCSWRLSELRTCLQLLRSTKQYEVMHMRLHAGFVPPTEEEMAVERQRRAAKKASGDGALSVSNSAECELELLDCG